MADVTGLVEVEAMTKVEVEPQVPDASEGAMTMRKYWGCGAPCYSRQIVSFHPCTTLDKPGIVTLHIPPFAI